MKLKVKINISLRSNNQNGGVVPLVEVGGTGQVAAGRFAHFLTGSIRVGWTEKLMEFPTAQEKDTCWKVPFGCASISLMNCSLMSCL